MYLIGLALVFSGAWSATDSDRCDGLYEAVLEVFRTLDYTDRDDVANFMALTREVRACYGEAAPERVDYMYLLDISALQRVRDEKHALRLLNDLATRYRHRPDSSTFWWLYSSRGNAHYYLNNLNAAAQDYALALTFSDHTSALDRAFLHLNYADVLQRLRDFASARNHRLQAHRLLHTFDTPQAQWTSLYARLLRTQADLLLEVTTSNTAAATDSLQKAIALVKESLALQQDRAPDENTVRALILLGDAYSNLTAFDAAHGYYQRALRVARQIRDAHALYRATNQLGRFFTRTGALDEAEKTLLDALSQIEAAQHLDYRRRTLTDLGYLYERWGKPEQAETYYARAIEITEQYHESLRLTDWSATAFGRWQEAYRGRVRVLLAQARFADAFLALEQTRARHLQDLHLQARLLRALAPADSARFDALTMALTETLSQLASDTLRSDVRNRLDLQKTRLITERRALLDLQDRLHPPPLAVLQQALAERGQVLLSYFIDAGDSFIDRPLQSYAFVLTPDTLAVVPLRASEDTLRTLLAAVSPLLTKADPEPGFNARQFSLSALQQLYDLLYAPVALYLAPNDRLVIIPDGPLFMLPFGMLVERETTAYQYHQAPFLLKKHPIAIELATALMLPTPRTTTDVVYDVVAFGKTDFSDVNRRDTPRTVRADDGRLIDLPAVEEELHAITTPFRRVVTRLDAHATEGAFFAFAPRTKILHLASHTLLRPASPLHNAIVLSQDPADDRYDGTLYLHEIQRQHLAAHLVVLSGCSTARGVLHRGEGLAGLQYAFRAMGAESSLATLWFVEDQATVRLMDAFYRALQQGHPKDVALQRAQLAYLDRSDEDRQSPFYWSAPVLYGNTTPLSMAGRRPLWLLWACLGGLLLVVFLVSRPWLRKRLATL